MGMYDTLHINTDKLPVSEEEKEFIKIHNPNGDWQTKSLDSILAKYEITDEGKLLLIETGWLEDEDLAPKEIPFHGFIHFYGYVDEDSYEFYAKFTDGKLMEIMGQKR